MGALEIKIKHENKDFFVFDTGKTYSVRKDGAVHATTDSDYSHNADGLSIAIARCDYLARVSN